MVRMVDLDVRVVGRPAPEGSHEVGANGYVMHSSKYLDAWRHAVNRDTRQAYIAAGITGAGMPLIPYPAKVWVTVLHLVNDEQCRAQGTDDPTGTPDGDKLLRATIDGLGEARAFGDDSQIVGHRTFKARAKLPGAIIQITDERPWWADMSRENVHMGDFTPSGEYRLVLERVGTDADGDRTWETVIEVTDSAQQIADTWLPSLSVRLAAELPAPAELPNVPSSATETGPKRGRPRKATPPAEPVTAVLERVEPAPTVAEPAPQPQAPAQPAAAPGPATRVNPFAKA